MQGKHVFAGLGIAAGALVLWWLFKPESDQERNARVTTQLYDAGYRPGMALPPGGFQVLYTTPPTNQQR